MSDCITIKINVLEEQFLYVQYLAKKKNMSVAQTLCNLVIKGICVQDALDKNEKIYVGDFDSKNISEITFTEERI